MVDHLFILTLGIPLSLGIVIVVLSNRIRIAPIAILLFSGIFLGPEFAGIIDPNVLGPDILASITSLIISIILFEGGLTLDINGYKSVGKIIIKIVTLGVFITWIIVSCISYYLFNFSWQFSFLIGASVVVTGPTVITPLLKQFKVNFNVSHILHWEGVLNDPIGVFLAVTCFDVVVLSKESDIWFVITRLPLRLGLGILIGWVIASIVLFLFRKKIIHNQNLSLLSISIPIIVFLISDLILPETGILSVVVTAFILNKNLNLELENIKTFSWKITEISIAFIFILLSSSLSFNYLKDFGF